MIKIWSTLIHMTGNQYAGLGFEVCCALGKKTNQIWMVERLLGNMNDFIYSGYQLIRSSKESYLIFITPDVDEYISNKKIKYFFDPKFCLLNLVNNGLLGITPVMANSLVNTIKQKFMSWN